MFPLVAAAAAMSASMPAGSWVTEDRSAVVRLAPCAASVCGTVAQVLATQPGIPQTDVHNPNPQMRTRPLVGLQILGGFKWSGTEWTGGRIYDPKTGKTYRSKLSLNSDGSLKVYGCVLFVCQTQHWAPAR